MRERPILFSGPMVRAILAGQKTQTRRVSKLHETGARRYVNSDGTPRLDVSCPYGQPGDRLWVRETWADDAEAQWEPQKRGTYYRADDDAEDVKADCDAAGIPFVWRPSIHMHRWRSRITLEIVSVRVQRLLDISETDALAEGITYADLPDNPQDDLRARTWFRGVWDSINGLGSCGANPWVWVVEFRRITP